MLKSDRSFHKKSFIQPYYVSYLDQYTQTFSAITKSITGLTGHPRVIIVVMIYRGGFVLARSLWQVLVCESLLAIKFT